MDAMVEALMPFVMFAAVLWGIEAIVTMLIRDHKKAKRKQAREKRRLEYQDRRMANDAEHAKVTRAMRYGEIRREMAFEDAFSEPDGAVPSVCDMR